ncbi:MAG: 30S ribosomal protein S18 [Gordonia sp. (in: high G+C Gram-positive bacteria)]
MANQPRAKQSRRNGPRPGADAKAKPTRNQLSVLGIKEVDYKDVAVLRKFLSDRGKIRSRRVTGLTPQQQRQVATAVRNAREMALLPFTSQH